MRPANSPDPTFIYLCNDLFVNFVINVLLASVNSVNCYIVIISLQLCKAIQHKLHNTDSAVLALRSLGRGPNIGLRPGCEEHYTPISASDMPSHRCKSSTLQNQLSASIARAQFSLKPLMSIHKQVRFAF